MTKPVADTSAGLIAEDTLVLASMESPVEMELVMDWLGQQRARNPQAKFDVLKLPPGNAPPAALTLFAHDHVRVRLRPGRGIPRCA